tara:strand:- start:25829 stop:27052 length:1224 start_codon:yes stop_codon:yes gene_type:complete
LSEFLDQRLEPKVARAIRLHLVQCKACTHEERALLTLSHAARCMPHEIPSTTLAEDVRANDRSWFDLRPAVWIAASLFFSAVIGFLAYGRGFEGGRADERQRIAATDSAPTVEQADTDDESGVGGLVQNVDPPLVPTPLDGDPADGGLADVASEVGPAAGTSPDRTPPEPASPDVEPGAKAQLASWVPDDHQAVRATQSLFADLDLIDSVPEELHRPMLKSQLQYFELDRWATNGSADRPQALEDVATLVRQMMDGLATNADPHQLVQLRRAGDRGTLWDDAYAATTATGTTGTRPELGPFVSSFAGELPQVTQRSLQDWLAYKDRWVQSSEDPSDLMGLIESLPRIWLMSGLDPDIAEDFQLPNLESLLDEIEWTVTENGARRGELNLQSKGIHSFRSIMIVIETR